MASFSIPLSLFSNLNPPFFSSDVFNYNGSVSSNYSCITFIPTLNHSAAIWYLNGVLGSRYLFLNQDVNIINITVIAEDRITQSTYLFNMNNLIWNPPAIEV